MNDFQRLVDIFAASDGGEELVKLKVFIEEMEASSENPSHPDFLKAGLFLDYLKKFTYKINFIVKNT